MTKLKDIYIVDPNYEYILELLFEAHKDVNKVIEVYFEKFKPKEIEYVLQVKPVNPYAKLIETCNNHKEVQRLKNLYNQSEEMIKYHSDKRLYKYIKESKDSFISEWYLKLRTFISKKTGFHDLIFSEIYSKCKDWDTPLYMKEYEKFKITSCFDTTVEKIKTIYKLQLQFVEDFNNHINNKS